MSDHPLHAEIDAPRMYEASGFDPSIDWALLEAFDDLIAKLYANPAPPRGD